MNTSRSKFALGVALVVGAIGVLAGGASAQEKVIRIPMSTDGPKTLDPVRGSTTYDNRCCSQVYQTLVQYSYLMRPQQLEPLLLEKMPEISEDGKTWRFDLRKGIKFHDDACFPGGKGRELVAADVFYSWKRLADPAYRYKNWWLVDGSIVGFNEYKLEQAARVDGGEGMDYDAPVEGLRILSDYSFEVELTEPVQQFRWKLAMFQLAIVPREAVETYGDRFNRHPVGTGPFVLRNEEDWTLGKEITFYRNPNYFEEYYPSESMPGDEEYDFQIAAGTKLPIVDKVEITFFVEGLPQWLEFKTGKMDFTTVPDFGFEEAFIKRSKRLVRDWRKKGIVDHKIPLLDFIFRGFNMEDELLGGYTEEKKALRQAINICIDWEEMNEAMYWGTCVIYDGPIPPGLPGYPEDGTAPKNYRGPDFEKARELLVKAGYTIGSDGKVTDLPLIEFYTSRGVTSEKMTELLERNLEEVGIRLNSKFVDFSTLMGVVDNRRAPFFSFAWGSDYPDAENNLALFYSLNASPGANHFNYNRPEFDRMYEQSRTMVPGPERTELYETMRDILIEDTPYCGSLARTRYYVIHPWLKNFKPTEDFFNYFKYFDIEMDHPDRPN